jgi:hypothetical protein
MGYRYRNTIPEPDAALMADDKSTPDKLGVDQIKALVKNIHGPEIGDALIRYSLNLKKAVDLSGALEQQATDLGGLPGGPITEIDIRSAAASYRAAADAAAELAGSAACTSSLCGTLPRALLGRILAAGLACEADALDDLLDGLPAPDPKSTPASPG